MRPLIIANVLCLFQLLDLSGQSGNYLIEVAYYAVICDIEDVSVSILVDGNDAVGAAHACNVLDSTGDAACDIEFGTNSLTGLSDLVSMCDPAAVNCCTGSAYYTAEQISEGLKCGVEALRASHSTIAGVDDISAFEIDHLACCINVCLKDAATVGFAG